MIRLLIITDCPSMKLELMNTVSWADDLKIVASMGSGENIPSQVSELRPDVVLVDIPPAGNHGSDTVSSMRNAGLNIPIVCLVDQLNRVILESSLQERVFGLVHKFSGPDELVEALRRTASGGVFVSPALTDDGGRMGADQIPQDSPDLQNLSGREREILAMVAAGETAADIAHRLGISGSTVYFHRRRIAGKIGLRQTADITRFAVRAGLVTEH